MISANHWMEPSALAAAAAAERTFVRESPRANFDMALKANVVRRSEHTPLDNELLHRSGNNNTTLQCDNDLKSGTGCSLSPPPAVPSKLHAVAATNGTERASAHAAAEEMHSACSTSLQGASALKSGTGHTDRTGAHVESCAALPSVHPTRSRTTTPLFDGTAPDAALPTSNTALGGVADT